MPPNRALLATTLSAALMLLCIALRVQDEFLRFYGRGNMAKVIMVNDFQRSAEECQRAEIWEPVRLPEATVCWVPLPDYPDQNARICANLPPGHQTVMTTGPYSRWMVNTSDGRVRFFANKAGHSKVWLSCITPDDDNAYVYTWFAHLLTPSKVDALESKNIQNLLRALLFIVVLGQHLYHNPNSLASIKQTEQQHRANNVRSKSFSGPSSIGQGGNQKGIQHKHSESHLHALSSAQNQNQSQNQTQTQNQTQNQSQNQSQSQPHTTAVAHGTAITRYRGLKAACVVLMMGEHFIKIFFPNNYIIHLYSQLITAPVFYWLAAASTLRWPTHNANTQLTNNNPLNTNLLNPIKAKKGEPASHSSDHASSSSLRNRKSKEPAQQGNEKEKEKEEGESVDVPDPSGKGKGKGKKGTIADRISSRVKFVLGKCRVPCAWDAQIVIVYYWLQIIFHVCGTGTLSAETLPTLVLIRYLILNHHRGIERWTAPIHCLLIAFLFAASWIFEQMAFSFGPRSILYAVAGFLTVHPNPSVAAYRTLWLAAAAVMHAARVVVAVCIRFPYLNPEYMPITATGVLLWLIFLYLMWTYKPPSSSSSSSSSTSSRFPYLGRVVYILAHHSLIVYVVHLTLFLVVGRALNFIHPE